MSEALEVPRLAALWDQRLRRDDGRFEKLAPEAIERGTLLREPAQEEDIVVAERRLNVTLPPTYRAFLLCSNGAYASSLGPEHQYPGGTLRHGFVPVEHLDRLDATEEGRFTIGLWTRESGYMVDPDREVTPTGDEAVGVEYFAPIKDALLISQPHDAFKDLLVPRPDREEWQLWTMAKEYSTAYRSFAAFLRNQIDQPDRRPNHELADLYAAEVRAGHRPRLMDLAEIGDPRVGDLAFAYMLDPNEKEIMKRGWAGPLGAIGDPAFIPDLRRVYQQATYADFRMELLYNLLRCGDPDVEDTLREVAENPNDDAQTRAASMLSRLHQLRPT